MSNGWEQVPLMDLCTPKQWPTISAQQLTADGFPVFGANGRIGFYTSYNHEDPTILVTCRGATCGVVNICEPHSYVTGNAMALDGLDTTRADLRFVYHALVARGFKDAITGTAQPQITRDSLRRVSLGLPPLSEQRRIADILDKADAIRRKRKEAIALTGELLRSAFLEMFGDPVTNPRRWAVITIGELCERGGSLVDGPFGSSLKPEHYTATGVRVVRNWNIHDDYFDAGQFKFVTAAKFEEIRRSEVVPEDILITTKGTVGDVCLMPSLEGPSVLSASGTVRLRLPPASTLKSAFVMWQMILPSYKRYLHSFEAGSAQQYLNLSAIKKMRLLVPPERLQALFIRLRQKTQRLAGHLQESSTRSEDLFSSIVHRAFRGELSKAPEAQLPLPVLG